MTAIADVLVLGAGPAGVGAAIAARRYGLSVIVMDEATEAGGQVYRAPAPGLPRDTAETRPGETLRATLAASGALCRLGEVVWSITPLTDGAGFRVDSLGEAGPRMVEATRLILATGAQERVVPFPGWTLPGIIGLAGATILLKSQGIAPGASTLVAGTGPLLAAVAAGILKVGGQVAAVVDIASRADWLATLPALAQRPALFGRGLGWHAKLRAAGVPLLFGHAIENAELSGDGLEITVAPVDRAGRPRAGERRRMTVDSVAIGHGLVPATDAARLLRAAQQYDPARGHWQPTTDAGFRASLPGLYVAGDGAGIAGADAAFLQGQIAGLSAAMDHGRAVPTQEIAALRRRTARAGAVGTAMARLSAPRAGQIGAITAETTVCRCEDVTRAEIDRAIGQGARDANQLKSWTRCGMGPCQGRVCGDIAGALLAVGTGRARAEVGVFTARTPLRPLPIEALTGVYDYADIRLPPAAPL
jgi:thioredoxin reductase/bacterioferritin-associated ferredoxin